MNAIRAWLDMDKELGKHLHKTLKKEYLKETNVNVFLKEDKNESTSDHKSTKYSLIFMKPDDEDEQIEIDKCSNDLSCMIRAMNENGFSPSIRQVQSIIDRYKELLEVSDLNDDDQTCSLLEKKQI